MDSVKEKLDAFTDEVLQESAQSVRQIMGDIDEKSKRIIAEGERNLKKEVNAYKKKCISQINSREGRRVSSHLLENKRKLFAYREQCAADVMKDVREKIDAFTASLAYGEHLEGLLVRALDILEHEAVVTVTLRPEDMRYTDRLLNAAHGVSVDFKEGDFLLGGLAVLCPSKNLRIDLTFDTVLSDAGSHFAELSGIDLE